MRALRPALAVGLVLAASCSTAPAARSPLRERLAAADSPAVEDAVRGCLTDGGWKVDPVGSVSGGSNVVSAYDKNKVQTQVFIHPPDQKPRITGGPDEDTYWACVSEKLSGSALGDDKGGPASDGGATGAGD